MELDGVLCGNSECRALIDEPPGTPLDERKPCLQCGSTSRMVLASAHLEAHMSAQIMGTVTRSLNELRLAVPGIIVGIGLAVGFGVGADGGLALSPAPALSRWQPA